MEANRFTGLLYGCALAALAFLASGGGHGIYLPIAVSSAPAGLFGELVGLFSAPLLWAVVGAAIEGSRHPSRRNWVALAILVHYGSAAFLASREPYGNLEPLRQYGGVLMGAIFTLWAAVYVAGQLVVWRALFQEE